MTAQARLFADHHEMSAAPQGVFVNETLGGYTIGQGGHGHVVDLMAEASLKFFGLVMVLSAGAQWLLPASVFTGDALMMHLGLMASFGSVGLALYWHANRGFREEVQVDTTHRELRLATRNTRGDARVRRRIPMREIESCFLRRDKSHATPAQLCLRVRGMAEPLVLASAPEVGLSRLHERLARDIRGPHHRVAARVL